MIRSMVPPLPRSRRACSRDRGTRRGNRSRRPVLFGPRLPGPRRRDRTRAARSGALERCPRGPLLGDHPRGRARVPRCAARPVGRCGLLEPVLQHGLRRDRAPGAVRGSTALPATGRTAPLFGTGDERPLVRTGTSLGSRPVRNGTGGNHAPLLLAALRGPTRKSRLFSRPSCRGARGGGGVPNPLALRDRSSDCRPGPVPSSWGTRTVSEVIGGSRFPRACRTLRRTTVS